MKLTDHDYTELCGLLPQGEPVYADGAILGALYRDEGTHRWYFADLDSLTLLALEARMGEDAYSRWCAETHPDGEGVTPEEALRSGGIID